MAFLFSIFLSAFLLFQVQPVIARYILPSFGGTPAVWTACMMFFQVALFCGYLYAHLLATRVPANRQYQLHVVFLGLSLLLLPIAPPDGWSPSPTGEPSLQILALLGVAVGVPFVLISASAPLLQHWFAGANPGKSPFRLYALSNLGSLVALLSYPTLVEPSLTLRMQSWTWSVLYVLLAASIMYCGVLFSRSPASSNTGSGESESSPVPWSDRVLWMALAACGTTLLLAMTNLICQDVAVVPFLWILPLALYLISYIIAFDKDAWYDRRVWVSLLVVSLPPLLYLMFNQYANVSISLAFQLVIYCAVLFVSCMVCHGELARRRSAVPQLTTFYLYVALGGALGGIFVNLVAPMVFIDFWELHIAIAATFVLLGVCVVLDRNAFKKAAPRAFFNTVWSLTTSALIVALFIQSRGDRDDAINSSRSFFGVMVVDETEAGTVFHERALYHGRVRHGRQLYAMGREVRPTTYFGPHSGVGHAILQHPRRRAPDAANRGLKMGIVGLGVGTLAAYGADQDTIQFYEIDPQVDLIARQHFSYLSNSSARVETTFGDARMSMEREFAEQGSNQFDILVIDAFSGDSIPMHLLTQEAFDLYAKHMRSDGILAVHITNQYVDLTDVIRNAASVIGMHAVLFSEYPENWYLSSNDWVLMGNNTLLHSSDTRDRQADWPSDIPRPIRWTDDFSNLFDVLDWK